MEKRVTFNERWLPYLLVAPQIVITVVFFFWPSAQAIWQSVLLEDAFGGNTKFVWFDNFASLLRDPSYYDRCGSPWCSAPWWPARAGTFAAAGGDGRPHHPRRLGLQDDPGLALCGGAGGGRRAVGLPVQSLGGRGCLDAGGLGIEFNYVINGNQALILIVIAAVWNQISYNFLFFLAGLQSIPKSLIEAAAIDGAGPGRRFWDIVFPLLSPTGFFLLVVNIISAFFGTFGIAARSPRAGRPRRPRSWSRRSTMTASAARTSAVRRRSR